VSTWPQHLLKPSGGNDSLLVSLSKICRFGNKLSRLMRTTDQSTVARMQPNCCSAYSFKSQGPQSMSKNPHTLLCEEEGPRMLRSFMRRGCQRASAGCRLADAGQFLRILLFFVLLFQLLGDAHGQSFWKSASPPVLLAGQGSVSVVGTNLIPGASDYTCSFRTDLVNKFRGEFEERTSQMSVMSSTYATCPSPPWDLPATTVVLEIFKSNSLLPKQVNLFWSFTPAILCACLAFADRRVFVVFSRDLLSKSLSMR
jgi:hypothetical protein